jgi:putative ABC transport system permease protein
MVLHSLVLALRHLWRRRVYTFIILLSLTIGFTCTNLMISFLIGEENTDSFHVNKQRIFQLFSNDPFGGKNDLAYVPSTFAGYLTDNYSSVENVCQVGNLNGAVLETGIGEFNDMIILSVDSSFFSFFSFPVIAGDAANALRPSTILISEEKARILFGPGDVVGKTLTLKTLDTSRLVTVAGVISKGSENSHLVFDALIHHSVLGNKFGGGASYVLLNNSLQAKSLESDINHDVARPTLVGPGKVDYLLKPLTDSYFQPSNKMAYVRNTSRMFMNVGYVVCAIIMFMASFNFINLFILSIQGRAQETGIKRTLGISFGDLIKASFIEVVLYVSIAFVSSLLVTYLVIPDFNSTLNSNLTFSYLSRPQVLAAMGGVVFCLAFVVVLVCVSHQWRTRPVSLMKNFSNDKVRFSRLLFTIQFVISITLAICSITIIRQMDYLEHEPLGFNRNMLQLQSPDKGSSSQLPVLKQELLRIPAIQHVTVCSGNPVSGNSIVRYDLDNGEFYTPFVFSGDEDLARTLHLTLVAGKFPTESVHGNVVNEKLVRQLNIVHPIGATIPGTDAKIVGVVKDFTCVSFKEEIPPVIISFESKAQRLLIDYSEAELSTVIPMVRRAWSEIYPGSPFSYQVIQQDLLKKYKSESFFYRIVVTFSITSMVITCFGLFGLSWAVSQSRVKEIGIRKVLGATMKDILALLSFTFLKRIMLAFVIAAPLGYLLMEKWLQSFVNRTGLNGWIFVASALVVIVISFVTLSFQTVKAALTNPVDELRRE